MRDGGVENGREHTQPNAERKSGGGSGGDFGRAIAKAAVAQICERKGFQAFQMTALDALSEIVVRYIHSIGKSAHSYANLAGRTECNVFDIIQGLEDLSLPQGFSGASDVDHCLLTSGVVGEIVQYVGESEDIPLAYSVPRFPVVKERKLSLSFSQTGEEPPGEHIPSWLPVFPEPHSCARLLRPDQKGIEPLVKTEVQKLKPQEGVSMLEPGNSDKVKQTEESNPFLSAPLHFGEKEVSRPILPATVTIEAVRENFVAENHVVDNHVSVLETFAPAIEAMKERSFDSDDGQRKVLLNKRPNVQFKIGIENKSVSTMLQSFPENKSFQKIAPWFERESEDDEKKNRAAKILKDSMESLQGLTQL